MTLKVADISEWQGIIDWSVFSGEIDAVVIRATYGKTGVDSRLKEYQTAARKHGKSIWYYHFKNKVYSPEIQAEHFIKSIGTLKEGEGLVLDDEDENKVNTAFIKAFAKRVKELTGKTIIVYSNEARFSEYKETSFPLWVAKYGRDTGDISGAGDKPKVSGMVMWQYTSAAKVAGVTQNTVDMNIFYGTVEAFRKLGSKPTPKPVPKPTPKPAPKKVSPNLKVDGIWGPATTKALQKALGTPVDGFISNQRINSFPKAIKGVKYASRGSSTMVVALQRKLGVYADGLIGIKTITALQRKLGTPADGKISSPSLAVKALQRKLNSNSF